MKIVEDQFSDHVEIDTYPGDPSGGVTLEFFGDDILDFTPAQARELAECLYAAAAEAEDCDEAEGVS